MNIFVFLVKKYFMRGMCHPLVFQHYCFATYCSSDMVVKHEGGTPPYQQEMSGNQEIWKSGNNFFNFKKVFRENIFDLRHEMSVETNNL